MAIRAFLALLAVAAPVTAIAAPDDGAAVRSAEADARYSPRDGGTLIELAQAYQRAGRTADAATTYRRALAADNAMLVTKHGDSVWSHAIARQALAGTTNVASR